MVGKEDENERSYPDKCIGKALDRAVFDVAFNELSGDESTDDDKRGVG